MSSHPAPKPGSDFDLQLLVRDKHKTGFPFLHYFAHLTSYCEVQPIQYILYSPLPPSMLCFKSPWMEPGLRCTIFPATVAVVLGPVQPHYFWEPNSHGPRNRRASSAFLALFPGIVSFVTSRAAFQPVNVCAGRSVFPVFSFRKGNLKFRMQPLFSSIYCVSFCVFFYFIHLALCCGVECLSVVPETCGLACTKETNSVLVRIFILFQLCLNYYVHIIYSVTFQSTNIVTIYSWM